MAGRVDGKVAVVTGGSSGLGRGIAERLAAEGARVVITDVQVDEGEEHARAIGAQFLEHDVTDEKRWDEVVRQTVDLLGSVDILVNNAGITGPVVDADPEKVRLADWQRVQSVNVDGVMLGCRSAIPAMAKSGSGSIVNMSSIASIGAAPESIAYGTSKAAVRHLTRSVATYCGRSGFKIRCNSVHPGVVLTPMFLGAADQLAEQRGVERSEILDHYRGRTLLGELQDVVDIANAVLFLVSDEARSITGIQLVVDGGMTVSLQQ